MNKNILKNRKAIACTDTVIAATASAFAQGNGIAGINEATSMVSSYLASIGAGPAGLSAACRLNAKGYEVTLFDSKPMPGGLLRYGIPNFKLDKAVIDRRMGVLEAEGIKFEMGVTVDVQKLPAGFDAYCICTGTPQARDLNIPGRELKGIYLALEMLSQQNHILDGETFPKDRLVNAKGKRVLGHRWR